MAKMAISKRTLDKLNCNIFGYTFEAVIIKDASEGSFWVRVRDQDGGEEIQEPDMPEGFNNVIERGSDCNFCLLPSYNIKYRFL